MNGKRGTAMADEAFPEFYELTEDITIGPGSAWNGFFIDLFGPLRNLWLRIRGREHPRRIIPKGTIAWMERTTAPLSPAVWGFRFLDDDLKDSFVTVDVHGYGKFRLLNAPPSTEILDRFSEFPFRCRTGMAGLPREYNEKLGLRPAEAR